MSFGLKKAKETEASQSSNCVMLAEKAESGQMTDQGDKELND